MVWGDNALARRLVRELMESYGAQVTWIVATLDTLDPDDQPTRVVAARRLDAKAFLDAGLAEASALALVDADDVANVDAALIAREVAPHVRVVLRMFNPILGQGVAEMLGEDCAVLSGSEIAAPAFVAAALGDRTPTYIRLPDGQLLAFGARGDFDDTTDLLCGLAITNNRAVPETLPADDDAADLVLVRAFGSGLRPMPRHPRRHPLRTARLLFGRNLRLIVLGLVGVLCAGTAALALLERASVWQAFYLTLLTALGAGNADLHASVAEQVLEMVLVLVGAGFVPALTAAVVEVVVKARLAIAAGGLTEPVADHVIVVGLGNVGTRVISELDDFGVPVVGIDKWAEARGVQVARDRGIPVIIANANSAETLRAASLDTCRALVVVSTDDVTNLETALLGRALYRAGEPGRQLRVVLRLFDEAFAGRIKNAFSIEHSRSVSSLSAPAFAAAMAGREVIDTISIARRVLLLAEILVGPGSQLEGRPCAEVSRPNEVRLIAVRTGRGTQTLWSLPERRPFVRTDRLLVVATRAGLAGLLERAAGVPDPPPIVDPPPLPLLLPRPKD